MSNTEAEVSCAEAESCHAAPGCAILADYGKHLRKSVGSNVRLRGFVSSTTVKGKRGFLVLRSGTETVQCVYAQGADKSGVVDAEAFSALSKISHESYVEMVGTAVATGFVIRNCTVQDVEVSVCSFGVLSRACELPFGMKDVSASAREREERGSPTVLYSKCLDNRCLDLRTPHSQSIFRVIDNVMHSYRTFLRARGFLEISTPKLIGTTSEGGANCFQVDYFGRQAFLAQSPQLYKQMAIIGGARGVYEIGHVYRAEESNINRYLSEFVGMDLEMQIDASYEEVWRFVYGLFVSIFDALKEGSREELEIIRSFREFEDVVYDHVPVVYTHRECVDMLREDGVEMEYGSDFNRDAEKRLGHIIKEKRGVDLFVVKDYPLHVRAFYTKRSDADPALSDSFDFILRGEEILSGARRASDYSELLEGVERVGIAKESISGYLDAFRYGVPPHGGVGLGLSGLSRHTSGSATSGTSACFPGSRTGSTRSLDRAFGGTGTHFRASWHKLLKLLQFICVLLQTPAPQAWTSVLRHQFLDLSTQHIQMRVLYVLYRSFTSSRKSTLSSLTKKNVSFFMSHWYSQLTTSMLRWFLAVQYRSASFSSSFFFASIFRSLLFAVLRILLGAISLFRECVSSRAHVAFQARFELHLSAVLSPVCLENHVNARADLLGGEPYVEPLAFELDHKQRAPDNVCHLDALCTVRVLPAILLVRAWCPLCLFRGLLRGAPALCGLLVLRVGTPRRLHSARAGKHRSAVCRVAGHTGLLPPPALSELSARALFSVDACRRGFFRPAFVAEPGISVRLGANNPPVYHTRRSLPVVPLLVCLGPQAALRKDPKPVPIHARGAWVS